MNVFAPSHLPRLARQRRGSHLVWITGLLVVVTSAGGYLWSRSDNSHGINQSLVLHRVERGDFELSITERGELEPAGVTEVRSEVKTQNQPGVSILRVVAEGTQVKAGDFLVELDSSALKAERITQRNLVNMAEAQVVETRNLYETALIAKEEYIDGTYVEQQQTIESEVFVAAENLNRAKEYYQFSMKLAAKGHVNELQLEADRFAIDKSAKELEAANTKLRVLDNYTKRKMEKQFDSGIIISEAKWGSAKKSYELERISLADIEDQITKCMIYAPKDSIVIYASEHQRRSNDNWVVKEGALVRERQVIFRLPDSGAMQVKLSINESLVQYIKPGMPSTIIPVGVDDVELHGAVVSINDYAESNNWRKADVKEYLAYISIGDQAPNLRSGMTVSATVMCDFVPNTLQVPVQAILPHGESYYCLINNDGEWEARKVQCGTTNSEFFLIKEGLAEGDLVSMNPRHYIEQVDLPELAPTDPKGFPTSNDAVAGEPGAAKANLKSCEPNSANSSKRQES